MGLTRHFFAFAAGLFLLLLSERVLAQPLPCPPINTTTITATGATTICDGHSTTLGNTRSTTVKSTTSYQFSTIPYLPTAFSGGTPVIVGEDDVYSDVIPLPFEFCFYGVKYNSCLIGANGEISFNTSLALLGCPWSIPGPIPTTAGSLNDGTLNTIMGAYHDIDPFWGGSVNWAIYGTAPCRTFVVSWDKVPFYNTGAGTCVPDTTTQQIVLYESTYAIDIFLHHKPYCLGWNSGLSTLGIVDATGANYNIAPGKNATVFAVDDSGYRFTPNGPAAWSYTWTGPGGVVGTDSSVVVSPSVTTTYTVTGVASSNCDSYTVRSTVVVTIGPNPVISHFSFTNPTKCGLCDGTIKLFGLQPGATDTIFYKYNGVVQPYVIQVAVGDSSLILTGLCADTSGATGGVGTYDSIVVSQVGGCHTDPAGPILLTNPPIGISFVFATNPASSCTDNGSLLLNGLYPGHAFTVTYDKNGVPQTPIVTTSSPTGTILIPNLSGTLPAGDVYSNIIAAFPACTTPPVGPFTLMAPPEPVVKISDFISPSQCGYCDGSITIRAINPYTTDSIWMSVNGTPATPFTTISLADSSIYLPGLCKGDYTDMKVKMGPCLYTVIGSASLVDPPLKASFTDTVHWGCNGDTVFYKNASTSAGPLFYIWRYGDGFSDTNTNPRHIFPQGIYTVTLIAHNHICVDSFKVQDSLVHGLHAAFVDTPFIYCQDRLVTLTNISDTFSDGFLTYRWIFGDGSPDDSVPSTSHVYKNSGIYNVQLVATNFIPCTDTASLKLHIDSTTALHLALTDSVICRSSYVTFRGDYTSIGNTGVSWNFGDGDSILGTNPVSHAYDAVGTFTVTVTPHYRVCRDTSVSKVFTIFPAPTLYIGGEATICKGSNVLMVGDTINKDPLATWKWSTGQTTPTIGITEPGDYTLTISVHGCRASGTISVKNDCYMNIPNVFTPNGDGMNDYFFPRDYLTKGLTQFSMNIYNRWGQLIFETTSLEGAGWDGKFNEVRQPEGVYVYVIDARFKDGQKEHHQGNVTLIR